MSDISMVPSKCESDTAPQLKALNSPRHMFWFWFGIAVALSFGVIYIIDGRMIRKHNLVGSWKFDADSTIEMAMASSKSDKHPTPAQLEMAKRSMAIQVGDMRLSFSDNMMSVHAGYFPAGSVSFQVVEEGHDWQKLKTEKGDVMKITFLDSDRIIFVNGGKEPGVVLCRE